MTGLRWMVPVLALATLPLATAHADPLSNGTFDPWVAYGAGPDHQAVASADLTGDGFVDVASVSPRELRVFPGDGTGVLGSPSTYPLWGYLARSVAAGDVNGDGLADVAVASQGQVELFAQTDGGGLTGVGHLTVEAEKVRIADVTSDGLADVVVIGWDRDAVSVYAQTTTGTLSGPTNYNVPLSGYNDLEVADVDGDGDNDIVAMSGQLYVTPDVTILTQRSGGMDVRSYFVPGDSTNANGIGVGDLDGDGLGEVVVSHGGNSPSSKVTVFEAASDGTLTEGATIAVPDVPEPVEVADYDRDGYDDVAVGHGGWNRISVLYGSGTGLGAQSEALAAPYASHYDGHGLLAVDLDGDGDGELVVADYNHGVLVYRNRATAAPSVADLSLSLVSPANVKVNVAFAQTLTILNQGDAATSGSVRIDVAAVLRVQSTPAGCTLAGQSLTCAVPTLAGGVSHAVSVTVKAPKPGSGTTRATLVSSSVPDADPSNDVASVGVSIARK